MLTTFLPASRSMVWILRVVWLLPAPVRTAHTAMTGLVLLTMTLSGPISMKSAPREFTRAERCMTYSYGTSE